MMKPITASIVGAAIFSTMPVLAATDSGDAARLEHDRATAELAASLVLAKLNDEIYAKFKKGKLERDGNNRSNI